MADRLVDTDIFIDHLRGVRRLDVRPGLAYSVITRAELFDGDGGDEGLVAQLLAPFEEIPVERRIAERAGRIRREVGTAMPDALIAATALEHDLVLMTRNGGHFDRVVGLQVQEPG